MQVIYDALLWAGFTLCSHLLIWQDRSCGERARFRPGYFVPSIRGRFSSSWGGSPLARPRGELRLCKPLLWEGCKSQPPSWAPGHEKVSRLVCGAHGVIWLFVLFFLCCYGLLWQDKTHHPKNTTKQAFCLRIKFLFPCWSAWWECSMNLPPRLHSLYCILFYRAWKLDLRKAALDTYQSNHFAFVKPESRGRGRDGQLSYTHSLFEKAPYLFVCHIGAIFRRFFVQLYEQYFHCLCIFGYLEKQGEAWWAFLNFIHDFLR